MKSMKKILCFGMMLFFLLTTVLPCNAEAYPETVQDSLTEDKGNFTSYGGSWEYTEDGYTQTDSMISGTSYHYGSYFQYSYEDFTVSFRMKLNKVGDSEGYAGMLFRKAKPDDTTEASGYMMAVKGYGSIYFQNWSETKTIFQLPLDTPYEWHTYKFEVEGTKIKFYLDGKLCQSIHDSDFSSGYFSFTTGTSSATFADFEISGTPIGNAESIGQINDGNLDKAAADVIFEERAAIDETEQAEEPSWFTTMISKLNGFEKNESAIVAASDGMEEGNVEKIVTVIVWAIAVIMLFVLVFIIFRARKNKKTSAAVAALLIMVLSGSVIMGTLPCRAEAEGADTFDEKDYYKVFYVSPEGNDDNAGTESEPFETLRKAQEEVRKIVKEQTDDIAVVLKEGCYTLGSQLSFDENDSGCNGYDVIWMSYPGDLVKVSGGREIEGWVKEEGDIWSAETDLDDIDSLYVNDVRANIASSGAEPLELLYYDTELKCIVVSTEDVKDVDSGSIMLYQDWETPILPIKSVETVADNEYATAIRFDEEVADLYFRVTPNDLYTGCTKYVLQDDKSLLDEAGEYYYDKETKKLYYIPREGENMETAKVCAPALDGLIQIKGSSTDSHVQNIVFRGMVFEYSGFISKNENDAYMEYQSTHYYVKDNGTNYPYMDVPTATLQIQNADNIDIERCVIRHSGGNGVNFYHSVYDSNMDGCMLTDISGSGILTGVYAYGLLPGDLYTPDEPEKTAVHNINITNNAITWIGRELKGGVGIGNMLGYEILIRNNEVAYISSMGIANGWGWSTRDYVVKENTIAYNDVHHVGMSTVDLAAIYTLNAQKGTQIRANYLHDTQRSGTGRSGAPVYGLYLDEGSNWLIVTDNVSVNNYDNDINFHNTGGSIYTLGNDTLNETTVENAGIGRAYSSISLQNKAETGTSLVQNVSLGQPENSFSGEAGMKITVSEDVTVEALGRFYYQGNAEKHQLTIYDGETGKALCSGTVDMSEGDVDENGFKYVLPDKKVKLEAGKTYYVVSAEREGGDVYMGRMCQVISNSGFNVDGAITCQDGEWNTPAKSLEGYMYGPVNLLFSVE